MRIVKATILAVVVCLVATLAYAQDRPKGTKGASEKAYEHASDQAIFNRVTDWFATVGKSEEEKAKILAERKAERVKKRAEKEAEKAKKKAEKAQIKSERKVKEKAREVEKRAGKAAKKIKKKMKRSNR